jgi:hypothetical protein
MIFERQVTECTFGTVYKYAPESVVHLKFVPNGGEMGTAAGDTVNANFQGQAITSVSIKDWGYYTVYAFGKGQNGGSITSQVPLTVKSEGYFTPGEILIGETTMLVVVLFFVLLIRHLKRLFAYELGKPFQPSPMSKYYKGALDARQTS